MGKHMPDIDIQEDTRKIAELPSRRKGDHSSTFTEKRIISNHYFVDLKQIQRITIFSVKLDPSIPHDNSKLRNQLLREIQPKLQLDVKRPVISGMNIYSTSEYSGEELKYTAGQYSIRVKKVKVYDLKQSPHLLLAFLNNSLRNIMRKLNYVEIGRSGKYFNATDKTIIDNLNMYNGYKSNFVSLEKGYFLRVDAAKKIVRNQTVLEFIDSIYAQYRDLPRQEKRMHVKNAVVNLTVMSNYGKTNYYRITDVQFNDLQSIVFDDSDIKLMDYYKDKYKITIKSLKQPLLVAEGKNKEKPLLLIPELMLMTGIPENFDEMRRKKISEQTIKNPNEKYEEISGLMHKLKKVDELTALDEIGIKLNQKMEEFKAKIIPSPVLELGSKNTVDRGKQACFNLFNKPIFQSKHDINLGMIYQRGTDVRQTIEVLQRTSKNLDVRLSIKKYEVNDRISVQRIQAEVENSIKDGLNICCIVIPPNLKTQYKAIKISAVMKHQMVTQVLTQAKLKSKNLQSIITKVLLQIIAKRGNTLWVPKSTCKLDSSMLAAFDSAKLGNSTLLALTATINSTFSSVYSATTQYDNNSARFGKMAELTCNAINAYVQRNDRPPKQVLLFQNSCTGDQVTLFHELLMKPLQLRLKEAYPQHRIGLTLLMINVKTSQRFFLQNGNNISNVDAGTLVSRHIVSPQYDFYIVSQRSTRGTSVPNHYRVIFTNSEVEEGILQEICFSQCFNYVNWTGSIKVPAIMQYAKKCAKFASEVLEPNSQVPKELASKLYYI